MLPGRTPFMTVVADARSERPRPEYTYLLDRDPRKVYDRLCATHPLGVEPDLWSPSSHSSTTDPPADGARAKPGGPQSGRRSADGPSSARGKAVVNAAGLS
ncbi:hypothetical protein GCM10023238_35870 [Streptomyces heliomycini]